MNKSQSISKYCLECSGGQVDERAGCVMVDCPLWEHRLGISVGKPDYRKRMKRFFESGKRVAKELRSQGLEEKDFNRPGTRAKKYRYVDDSKIIISPILPAGKHVQRAADKKRKKTKSK